MSAYAHWQELQELRRRVDELTPDPTPPSAAKSFYDGLTRELPKASAEGRMDDWHKCANSIAELLVADEGRRAAIRADALTAEPVEVEPPRSEPRP